MGDALFSIRCLWFYSSGFYSRRGITFPIIIELCRFIWRVDERVGKEIKESTAQRNLALFLLRRLAFKVSLLSSLTVKALRPLPLALSGYFFKTVVVFLHSENTISEHIAIFKKNIWKLFKCLQNFFRFDIDFFNFSDISLAILH